MKQGFFFSLDALLAGLMLIGGLVLVSSIADVDDDTQQLVSASQDTLNALEAVQLNEMEHQWVKDQLKNVSDGNVTVLEQIGHYWALGQTDKAEQLAEILLNGTAQGLGIRLTINGQEVYKRNGTKSTEDIELASRMISGIASGEAIKGSSASAYLKRIKDKRTNSFTIFGGFVGQGNISARFLDLPSDANVSSVVLEAAMERPFEISFNGIQCGSTYTPTAGNGTPDRWDLSTCNQSFTPGGTNILEIDFLGPLNESYVAGGFLKVKYRTQSLNDTPNQTFVQYRFPGIDGIVNLYDAFHVPGTLLNMSAYLHYNTSNSTYLQIGDKRVWEDDPNGTEKVVILNDTYLRDPLKGKLDYDFLSNKTIPIRMAGFSPNSTTVIAGNADVVVITDFSGSMKKAVRGWDQGNLGDDCNDDGESATLYNNDEIRRTRLATCLDKVLVAELMNYSGNRIWPVFLYNDQVKWYNNPEDESGIDGYIDSFSNGKGKTCYACALNRAYEILKDLSNDDKEKFIVFMTDGVPTHCPAGGCPSNSTSYGTQQCEGMCDVAGNNCGDLTASCTECQNNPDGQSAAYYAANRSANEFNATIYTVGFGPVTDCSLAGDTLQELANIGNGTYQHSNDSEQLKLIYENISQEILNKINLQSQTAVVQGGEVRSRLFDDSYINITVDPAAQYLPSQNALSITLQTDQACNPSLELFSEQELIEAQAVSYSGIHWTDLVQVNGNTVYNLSDFLKPYGELGDPTLVNTPLNMYGLGVNTVNIETGDSPTNRTGCKQNNSIIYTVRINLSTERSNVVPNATGCEWQVQFEDDTYENMTIPASYNGSDSCFYNATNIIYDDEDAYQLGAYEILRRLDFRKEGKLFVNLQEEDLEIVVTTIGGVPYMWGPAVARVEVTR